MAASVGPYGAYLADGSEYRGGYGMSVDELRAGRLVTPFDLAVRDDFAYWLTWPTARSTNPEAMRFRDWLQAKAIAEEHPCPLPIAEDAA